MLRICLHGYTDPQTLDHWSYVLSHWQPDEIYVLGGNLELDTKAFDNAKRILSADELPKGCALCIFSPQDARYFKGDESLTEFEHPKDAIYMFGSNKKNLSEDEMGYRLPDRSVYIPTDTHHEMYDFVAAAVVLYDRQVKHG